MFHFLDMLWFSKNDEKIHPLLYIPRDEHHEIGQLLMIIIPSFTFHLTPNFPQLHFSIPFLYPTASSLFNIYIYIYVLQFILSTLTGCAETSVGSSNCNDSH